VAALKLLVLCGRNLRRSPTAELLYRNDPRVVVRSAGLSPSSRRLVNAADVTWADHIAVMETKHCRRLIESIPKASECHVTVLDIPDEYDFNDPELRDLLSQALESLLATHDS